MDTCILYLRKSDQNATDDDFDIQEDICRRYAESKGYAVVAVYREAHSGKHSPLTRVVLRQAIADIKARRANVLVIRDYDRLARTIEQTYAILFEVENRYHGRIEAAQAQLDRTSPVAKIQFAVLAAASELERDRIYERMEAGKKKRAERGALMGSPNPRYGYRWVDDAPGHRTAYEVDPVTGEIVARVFSWAETGQSTRWIARELNRQGVLTPSAYAAQYHNPGKRHVAKFWHAEQVRVILEDERYAGKPVAYRMRTADEYRDNRDREYKVRALRAAADTIALSTAAWPPLITPAQFATVQARLKTNVAGRRPKDMQATLFRGQVYCGVCGQKMVAQRAAKTNKYVYVCRKRTSTAAHPSEACPGGGHNIRAYMADDVGWKAVKFLLTNRVGFTQMLREQVQTQPAQELAAYVESTVGALREKQEQHANLARRIAMTSDDTTAKAIIAQMEAVAEDIKKLEAQAQEAHKQADKYTAADAWVESVVNRIYGWHSAWVAQTNAGDNDAWPTDAQMQDYDALPYELKRLAVEASGVKVKVWPSSWRQDGTRLNVAFEDSNPWYQMPPGMELSTSTRTC